MTAEPWARVIRVVRDDAVGLAALTGEDCDAAAVAAQAAGGSVDSITAHLTQWGRGGDTDDEAVL